MALGTVTFFLEEEGWGAISSPDLPDGRDAWVHFSAIDGDGYKSLVAGEDVEFEFEFERGRQDGFDFRATAVRRLK